MGGLEGFVWDLSTQSKDKPDDYCAFIIYLEVANCGNDCLEPEKVFYMFSFKDQTVYWD